MKSTDIKPLADRVLIKREESEKVTKGGIIIPDEAAEKLQKGTVIACGPGIKDEDLEIQVGDTILFGKYAGNEVECEDGQFLFMRLTDILAKEETNG